MIAIDPREAADPSEQIRRQIADQVRSGALPGGERLPSIRQLAGDLRVAAGTVAKAYATLEADGLLEAARGRGTRVAHGQAHSEDVRRAASSYVSAVPDLSLEDALGAVRAAWADRTAESW